MGNQVLYIVSRTKGIRSEIITEMFSISNYRFSYNMNGFHIKRHCQDKS